MVHVCHTNHEAIFLSQIAAHKDKSYVQTGKNCKNGLLRSSMNRSRYSFIGLFFIFPRVHFIVSEVTARTFGVIFKGARNLSNTSTFHEHV